MECDDYEGDVLFWYEWFDCDVIFWCNVGVVMLFNGFFCDGGNGCSSVGGGVFW